MPRRSLLPAASALLAALCTAGRAGALTVSAGSNTIVYPDRHWNDTTGARIEAHAAGMLRSPTDGRWYWYGESRKLSSGKKGKDFDTTQGVTCYSADTIAGPWTFEGKVLKNDDIVVPGAKGPWVVQRPKVIYNNMTRKFVLWFHLDQPKGVADVGGYQFRSVGTATADHPAGPFTWASGFQPDGIPSLDMNLFLDPLDGSAYLIRDCEHKYVGISRLSADYLNTTGVIAQVDDCEGMAMFRLPNGTYYLITSHLTGWSPNPLIAWRSKGTSLVDAEWDNLGNPTGSKTSFNSQPTYVVQYTPSQGAPYFVYMGDDWEHCPNADGSEGPLLNACYVWLPIQLGMEPGQPAMRISYAAQWDLEDPFAAPTPTPAPAPTPAPPAPVPGACAVEKQLSGAACTQGESFGCYPGNQSMWTWHGCRGEFTCDGVAHVKCDFNHQSEKIFHVCECG